MCTGILQNLRKILQMWNFNNKLILKILRLLRSFHPEIARKVIRTMQVVIFRRKKKLAKGCLRKYANFRYTTKELYSSLVSG